jgi:hypothetical protein
MVHGVEGAWILAETDGHVFSALTTALIVASAPFNIAWTYLLIISRWKVSQPDFPMIGVTTGIYCIVCSWSTRCAVEKTAAWLIQVHLHFALL